MPYLNEDTMMSCLSYYSPICTGFNVMHLSVSFLSRQSFFQHLELLNVNNEIVFYFSVVCVT